MKISAIIRTKNSDRTLAPCIESLNQQTIAPQEIIVVDSGSTDNTIEIAKQNHCKIIHYPADVEFNYSKALNLGIAAASSEYILIVSSHVQLKYANTSELMLSFLTDWNQICAVSTVRESRQTVKKLPSRLETNWKLINRQNFEGQGMYNFCSLIRKADWETYPFNEELPRCEDQDWVKHFYQTQNSGSIVINHPTVFYNNPYYNSQKDAWDYIILGRYIYPYFISKQFVFKLLREALQNLLKLNFEITLHKLFISYCIVVERLQGIHIQSTYNALLSKKGNVS